MRAHAPVPLCGAVLLFDRTSRNTDSARDPEISGLTPGIARSVLL